MDPGLDHVEGTGKHGRHSAARDAHQSSLEGARALPKVISVEAHNDLADGEEGHVEGDVSEQRRFEAVIETADAGGSNYVHEAPPLDVGQHHGSLRRTTWNM